MLKTILKNVLELNRNKIVSKILIGVALLGILGQMIAIGGFLERRALPVHLVSGVDNDSAVFAGTINQTRFWNDNHYNTYGPVYFRIAHLLNHLSFNPFQARWPNDTAESSKSAFWSGMATSLIAIVMGAMIVAHTITPVLQWQLVLTGIFTAIFVSNPVATEIVLRLHPDHTAAVFIALYTMFAILHLAQRRRIFFVLSAIFFGIAANTKFVVPNLVPSLLVFLLFASHHDSFLARLKSFLGFSVGWYFIIGFPQSISGLGHFLAFLIQKRHDVAPATLVSLHEWGRQIVIQGWLPVLTISLFAVVLPKRNWTQRQNIFFDVALLAFAFLPLAMQASMHLHVQSDYYLVPYMISSFLALALWTQRRIPVAFSRFQNIVGKSNYLALATMVVWPFFIAPVPDLFAKQTRQKEVCILESRAVTEAIEKTMHSGGHVLTGPYTPKRWGYAREAITTHWYPDKTLILPTTRLIVLRTSYYSGFLPKEMGGEERYDSFQGDRQPIAQFYSAFANKSVDQEFNGPTGRRWKKTYQDGCGWELFSAVELHF